jgi:ADP-heptose:LPS heptosyltransferase
MRPLFCDHPLVDGVMTPGPGGFWTRVFRLARSFRSLQADAVVVLQPDAVVETAAWLARVPIRAGWARRRFRPQFLTHSRPYSKSEGTKHEARYNFDVLGLVGVPEPATLEPSLRPDPAARGRLAARLGAAAPGRSRAVALHLAAHGAKPRAPLAVLAGLAGWLRREKDLQPVLVGTEPDPSAAAVAREAGLDPADLTDLRGATDLAELAWLLGSAALCASRDSGPAHLAAAMGCPTLVFFVDPRPILGPTRWRPLGRRVEILPAEPASFTAAAAQAAAARLLAP